MHTVAEMTTGRGAMGAMRSPPSLGWKLKAPNKIVVWFTAETETRRRLGNFWESSASLRLGGEQDLHFVRGF
jgi:hypothetical protein